MAGKDFKVQKKAKEQQRLSVFQPAFRWGGNNNATSSGSSSKIEANKSDRRPEVRKNERVDQPRRNDNRLVVNEDLEGKMARDAKRMTTFQPIFGSLFSSKPPKGKSPQTAQPIQAHRPPANGLPSHYSSSNQAADTARQGAANGGLGSSKGARTGPAFQNSGLRIDTQETRSSNSRRNETASNSYGRNGRGGLAPVSEGYSTGPPRSPLQRNPAFAIPDDETMPLGISNAFGGKGKANMQTSVPPNSTAYSPSGKIRDARSIGQDRGISPVPSSGRVQTRDDSPLRNQKVIGVDTEYNPAAKRERMGIGFQRDNLDATNQVRLGEIPKRKPAVSNPELQTDTRSQPQSRGKTREDGKLAPSVGRSQNVPQLVVTDTSDVSSSGASGRPDRPFRAQQGNKDMASQPTPGQRLATDRKSDETSGSIRPGGQPPPTSDGTGRPRSRSPLDRDLTPKATQAARDVSSGGLQEDHRRVALSQQTLPPAAAAKPSLSVFPRQQPPTRPPLTRAEPETTKSKGLDPLQPTLGGKEVEKLFQVRYPSHHTLKITADEKKPKDRQALRADDSRATPMDSRSDATANLSKARKAPMDEMKASSARDIPRAESPKFSAQPFRSPASVDKSQTSVGQQQVTNGLLATGRPRQRDNMTLSDNPSTNANSGRPSASRTGETARPVEAEQPRTGWASRYYEAPKSDKSNDKPPNVERSAGFGKDVFPSSSQRDLFDDQDSPAPGVRQGNGADAPASSFKQRMKESLGDGKESNVIKPLTSRFNGTKQDVSQTFPEQMSRPLAGVVQPSQIDAKAQRTQQSDSPAIVEKPSKGWSPYTTAKDTGAPKSSAQATNSRNLPEAGLQPSSRSGMPTRPDRPQDELFMGVSGSTLRPDPLFDNTTPSKHTPLSLYPDRRLEKKSPRGTDVPNSSETNTGRSDLPSTRKPAEVTPLNGSMLSSPDYSPVIGDGSANGGSTSSRGRKAEVPAVRTVSRIIERPREIDIHKPIRQGNNTQPSDLDDQASSGKPKALRLQDQRKMEVEQSISSQVAEPSGRLEIQRGDRSRNHRERFETPKLASVNDEWPRPSFEPTKLVAADVAHHSGAIDGEKVLAPEGQSFKVPEGSAPVATDTSQSSGLLGRWVGRAKKDKTPERTNQSTSKQTPLTADFNGATSGLESGVGDLKLASSEGADTDTPAPVKSGISTRNNVVIPSITVVEPPSKGLADTSVAQNSASASLSGQRDITSSSQMSTKSDVHDVPAPLIVGGRKPNSANGRLADHENILATGRVGQSEVISPELPSQEAFFKQMRQSVLFQNAESAGKTEVPESNDATTKRKSRRNRNVSISGLHPVRGVTVPDVPTFDDSEYRSSAASGDEKAKHGVPQAASDAWPRQSSFEDLQKRDVSGNRGMNGLDVASSRPIPRGEQLPTVASSSGDSMSGPSVFGGQIHASSIKQAGLRTPDMDDKMPFISVSPARDFEQDTTDDSLLFTSSRGPGFDRNIGQVQGEARPAQSGRAPLRPSPSHTEMFRRPSFDEREIYDKPITTHNLPPAEAQADAKVQNFFDGLFKGKEAGDLALGLGTTSSDKSQATGASPSASKGIYDANKQGLAPSVADTPPSSGMLESPPRTATNMHDSRTPPFTPHGPVASGVPRSFVEGVSAPPASQEELEVHHLRSPEQFTNFSDMNLKPSVAEPISLNLFGKPSSGGILTNKKSLGADPVHEEAAQCESSLPNNTVVPPIQKRSSYDRFTELSGRTDQQLEGFDQSKLQTTSAKASSEAETFYAPYEPSSRDLVVESVLSRTHGEKPSAVSLSPASMRGSEYQRARNEHGVQHVDVQNQETLGFGGSHSYASPLHVEGQEGFYSPSEIDGHSKQATGFPSFDSPSIAHGQPPTIEERGTTKPHTEDAHNTLAKQHMSHEVNGHFQSPHERDHILSNLYPPAGAGSTSSPQESDPDLSDHILSLYDGSEYVAPDHQATGNFANHPPSSFNGHGPWSIKGSAYTRSELALDSPVMDRRASVSSIEPMSLETSKTPSTRDNASEMPTTSRSANTPSTLGSTLRSSPSFSGPTSPPHELSDPVNVEAESMAPAPLKAGGVKDKIRQLFGQPDGVEPKTGCIMEPQIASPVPVLSGPSEQPGETIVTHGDHGMPIPPRNYDSQLAIPSYDTPEAPESGSTESIILHEAIGSHGLVASPSQSLAQQVDMDQLHARDLSGAHPTPNYASPMLESRPDQNDLPQDWTPSQGAALASPRSAAEFNSGLSSPLAVEDNHSTQEPMTPDSSDGFVAPSGYNLDQTPAASSTEQRNDFTKPMSLDSSHGKGLSPNLDRPFEPVSPLDTGYDKGHFPPENSDRIFGMDGLDTHSSPITRDNQIMDGVSRPVSFIPQADYNATSDRATPDIDEPFEHRLQSAKDSHEMITSLSPSVDAFDAVAHPIESMREAETAADDHLPMSPPRTAHYVETNYPEDPLMHQDDGSEGFGGRVAQSELSSPAFEYDTFQHGDSPMPQEREHNASGGIEPFHDTYEESPRSGHLDEQSTSELLPTSPMAANESFSTRSPAREPCNDEPMHTGNYSPVPDHGYSDGDDANMLGDAEPTFDAPAGYPSDHGVSDNVFAAEPSYSPRGSYVGIENDYRHSLQGSGHAVENEPVFGGSENREGNFDDFGGDGIPADDLYGDSKDLDDTGMDRYPADDFPKHDGGIEGAPNHSPDAYRGDLGGFDDSATEPHPVDNFPSNEAGFEEPVDSYPADDFQSHSGAIDNAGTDNYPADDFPNDTAGFADDFDNYGAGPYDDNNGQPFTPVGEEPPPPYEQDHDLGYPADNAGAFDPIDNNVAHEEPVLSDFGGGEKDMDFGPEPGQSGEGDMFHGDDYQQGPLGDEHFGDDALPGDEPHFDDQRNSMNFADDKENGLDEFGGEGGWNDQMGDPDLDRGLNDDVGDFGAEPMLEADGEQPADFVEGAVGDDGEPFGTDFAGDYPDADRSRDDAGGYPMQEGNDLPMGGEAEEYFLGGAREPSPVAMEGGDDFPMGGEAEDYLLSQEGGYPMDPMEGGEEFPADGQDDLPIDEMYGGEERSLSPFEGDDEFPMDDGEVVPAMDVEDEFPMEGEGIDEPDRDMDDFDADDQYEDGLSGHDSVLDEEQESQVDGSVFEDGSVVDEEVGSDYADEERELSHGETSDEEPLGGLEPEDEDLAPSEVDDGEIEDDREIEDGSTSLAGEETEDAAEGDRDMDDLYEADVPSIPASPTSTDYGRELVSPTSALDHEADDQDDDSIFGDLAAQQEPSDLENADPVRLSCLYTQDVGLLSSPPTPTVPQEVDAVPEQGEDGEVEPREPVRFSALYRQSLDWSQALDSSMWEDDDEDMIPEESTEPILAAPVLQPVPDSARRSSTVDLRTLDVGHEQLTPVAASPLSPRPLETPPPDADLNNEALGDTEASHLVDQPAELYKGVDENVHQQYTLSPRLQPTPPPEQDRTSTGRESEDNQRDSRGPRTFDEMNLPRRVISPPNTGEDQDDPRQGSSSTQMPMRDSRRSISQRFSGWWSGSGGSSSGQVRARPPPLPTPYDSRYGEPGSPA